MKFVKQNLVPLICGVIVLLALVAWLIWPLPGMAKSVQDDLAARYAQANAAKGLVGTITLPGGQTIPNATYESNIIEAGQKAVRDYDNQLKRITDSTAQLNQKGRIVMDGKIEVPLLGGVPQPNYLPKMKRALAVPQRFAYQYQNLLKTWNIILAGKDIVATPPSQNDVHAAWDAEQRARNQPLQGSAIFGGGNNAGSNDPAEFLNYERKAVSSRANEIHMYVDPTAFQHRAFYLRPVPPNSTEIFDGLVDCWLQQDVVKSIAEVNGQSKNVGTSPIKRLEQIAVGVMPGNQNSYQKATGLFLVTSTSGQAPTPAPAGTDYTRTMTGRVDNAQYDVVLMDVVMDLDPAYENRFIDTLYRQNNGYTVLNIRTTTVDPFDAASNGYLYGKTQVVRVDMLVECLLFRSWTVPIMDNAHRSLLGIPLYQPDQPAAPGAAAPQ